jgi:flagellar biosynthesis protein FlhB
MATVLSFLLRVVLLAAGLVVALSFAVAFAVVVAVWLVRAAWARLTGKSVSPFVVRINPRKGFTDMYRRGEGGSRTPRADSVGSRRPIADVTDVEPRQPGV